MNRSRITFNPTTVATAQWLDALRSLQGIRGSKTRSYLARNADGSINLENSSLRCDGVILGAAKSVGWLSPDFDLNSARWKAGQTLDDWCNNFFETNFVRVAKNRVRPGDVLRMWFQASSRNRATQGPHHLAVLTTNRTRKHSPRMIHAEGEGTKVIEVPMDKLDWAAVESVWRPRYLIS